MGKQINWIISGKKNEDSKTMITIKQYNCNRKNSISWNFGCRGINSETHISAAVTVSINREIDSGAGNDIMLPIDQIEVMVKKHIQVVMMKNQIMT